MLTSMWKQTTSLEGGARIVIRIFLFSGIFVDLARPIHANRHHTFHSDVLPRKDNCENIFNMPLRKNYGDESLRGYEEKYHDQRSHQNLRAPRSRKFLDFLSGMFGMDNYGGNDYYSDNDEDSNDYGESDNDEVGDFFWGLFS